MHPTMERLFMYSLLTGRMTDLTWPDTDDESASGAISDYGDTCVGHAGSDVFPFGMLDTDIDGFEVRLEIGARTAPSPPVGPEILGTVALSVVPACLWQPCLKIQAELFGHTHPA